MSISSKASTRVGKSKAAKAQIEAAASATAVKANAKQQDWKVRFMAAVEAAERHGVALLNLVLEARKLKCSEQFVRDTVKAAYLAVGCNPESARKRASDAVTVFNAKQPANKLPGNLQQAASAVRKEKAGTQRAPQAAGSRKKAGEAKPAAVALANGEPVEVDLTPLEMIREGINAIKRESDDIGVLQVVQEMLDLLESLEEAETELTPVNVAANGKVSAAAH